MPGLNRKGPEGQGSQTGRKMGKCNPNNNMDDLNNNEGLQTRTGLQNRGENKNGLKNRQCKGQGRGHCKAMNQ